MARGRERNREFLRDKIRGVSRLSSLPPILSSSLTVLKFTQLPVRVFSEVQRKPVLGKYSLWAR